MILTGGFFISMRLYVILLLEIAIHHQALAFMNEEMPTSFIRISRA
jgi:hypothetical protein